jgi:hypothetical protein
VCKPLAYAFCMLHGQHGNGRRGNTLGSFSLAMGVVALVFSFVPVAGEFVAAPSALLAIGLGLAGLARVEKGRATNGGQALAGSLLGLLSGLILFLVFAATFDLTR